MKNFLNNLFAPETKLPLCAFCIGVWIMCLLVGITLHKLDLIVLPILMIAAVGYTVYNTWDECRSNRIIAEGIIKSMADEIKKSLPEQLLAAKPVKNCPPHRWEVINGKYACGICHNPPGNVK